MVSFFITLIAAPISIKVWGIMVPLMLTSTTRLPGSRYFRQITCPSIKLENCHMTLMVDASILCLPGCMKNFSLIILLYIGTYFMIWRSGILTYTCFNSPRSLVSYRVGCVVSCNPSGKGGIAFGSLSSLSSSSSLRGG